MTSVSGTLRALYRVPRSAYLGNSVSLVAISRMVSIALTLMTAPIIARAIAPVGRGETATAIAAITIVPILVGFGLPLEMRRRSATQNSHSSVRAARDICIALFFPSALVSAILFYTVFASMPFAVAITASLGVALAPLSVSWLCDQSVLIGRGNFRAVALIQLAQPVMYVSIVALGFAFGLITVQYVIVANLAGVVSAFAVGLHVCRASFLGARDLRKSVIRGGIKYAGSSIVEASANRLDQILVLPLIGAFGAGLYSIAVTVSSIPLSIGHALGAHFFNLSARQGPSARSVGGDAIRSAIVLVVVFVSPIAFAVPFLVPVVFGSDFEEAVPSVLVSLIGSVFMTIAYVGSMVLAGAGRGGMMTYAQLGCLIVGISFLYLLAPIWGSLGASVASASGYLVLFVIIAVSLKVRPAELLPKVADIRYAIGVLR